jgi:putative ABC transport system permease protein
VHVDPRQVGAVQRALFNAYPTVTVINIADVIETIQGVVQQITVVVRFLAAFSILSGAVILASSIASTHFRRVREVVVLKTLGAKRNHIAAVFSVEFIVLGLLAGLVGVIFANLLHACAAASAGCGFHVEWLATAVALVGTAVLATVTGWAASFRILGQKPLQVLREEFHRPEGLPGTETPKSFDNSATGGWSGGKAECLIRTRDSTFLTARC